MRRDHFNQNDRNNEAIAFLFVGGFLCLLGLVLGAALFGTAGAVVGALAGGGAAKLLGS